ncbi:MAG: PD-(D/E)XK nuclease family protein [Deltaproteobacteria bacterium]
MSGESKTDFVKGYVTRIASEPQRAKRGDYLFRGLEISVAGGAEKAFLIVPETICEFGRPDLYDFPLLCWEGAEIAAFEVELNNRLHDGTAIYTATPETDLLLEPCRPVSVTDAVEAAACIHATDLSYRVRPAEPFWMAKGRLIHTLFDHLLQLGAAASDQSFRKAFREARSTVVEILPGSSVSVDDRALEEEAGLHFSNLRRWLHDVGCYFDTVRVEVDRMSTRWGLKGRADALLQTKEKDAILELKTGRFAMEDHRLQLLGYALLFADADDGPPAGYLLYSALGRSETVTDGDRWRLLEGRNRVIGLKHSYTLEGAADHRSVAAEHCPRTGKCFARSTCRRFFGNASAGPEPFLQGLEREYYNRWFRLLSLEAWELST